MHAQPKAEPTAVLTGAGGSGQGTMADGESPPEEGPAVSEQHTGGPLKEEPFHPPNSPKIENEVQKTNIEVPGHSKHRLCAMPGYPTFGNPVSDVSEQLPGNRSNSVDAQAKKSPPREHTDAPTTRQGSTDPNPEANTKRAREKATAGNNSVGKIQDKNESLSNTCRERVPTGGKLEKMAEPSPNVEVPVAIALSVPELPATNKAVSPAASERNDETNRQPILSATGPGILQTSMLGVNDSNRVPSTEDPKLPIPSTVSNAAKTEDAVEGICGRTVSSPNGTENGAESVVGAQVFKEPITATVEKGQQQPAGDADSGKPAHDVEEPAVSYPSEEKGPPALVAAPTNTFTTKDSVLKGSSPVLPRNDPGKESKVAEKDNGSIDSDFGSDSSDSDSSEEGSSSSDDESCTEATAAGIVDKESSQSAPSQELAEAAVALKGMEEEEEEEEAESGPLRTQNEKDADSLEIPRPTVAITEVHSLRMLGKVSGVMDKAVIVMSLAAERATSSENRRIADERELAAASALDAGSVVCFEDRTVLGEVFETFGPVVAPLYIIRFNSREEIEAVKATVGREVFSVPELCKTVHARDVRRKGYDSSNIFDEETQGNQVEFSDDEAEAEARRGRKRGKRDNSRGGTAGVPGKRGRGTHSHGWTNRNYQPGWEPRQRGRTFGSAPAHSATAYGGMVQRGGFPSAPASVPFPSPVPNSGYPSMSPSGFPNMPANANFPSASLNAAYPSAALHDGYPNAPFMHPASAFPPGVQWAPPPPVMLPGAGAMHPGAYPGGMSSPFAIPGGPSPFDQEQFFPSGPGVASQLHQQWPGAVNGASPPQVQSQQYQWPGAPPPHNFPPPRQ